MTTSGHRLGAPVALAKNLLEPVRATDGAQDADPNPPTRWNVIAHELTFVAFDDGFEKSTLALTRTMFEECVANFGRMPHVPLVVNHADTAWFGHGDDAVPKGWVHELRVGTMDRAMPGGGTRTVTTLEARLILHPDTKPLVFGDPAAGVPPTYPFCSVTLYDATSEETGAALGCALWSLSLTEHPRLESLPRLAASRHAHPHREPAPRASPSTATRNLSMKSPIERAAKLGLTCPDDATAEAALLDLATDGKAARDVLGTADGTATRAGLFALAKDRADLSAARTELAAAQAARDGAVTERDAVRAELAAEKKARHDDGAAARRAHVEDVALARGWDASVTAMAQRLADLDYAAWSADHPRPSRAELAQRAQDGARLTPLTVPGGDPKAPASTVESAPPNPAARAEALRVEASKYKVTLSTLDALRLVEAGVTPETLVAYLPAPTRG